jgi:hypothetical protein
MTATPSWSTCVFCGREVEATPADIAKAIAAAHAKRHTFPVDSIPAIFRDYGRDVCPDHVGGAPPPINGERRFHFTTAGNPL